MRKAGILQLACTGTMLSIVKLVCTAVQVSNRIMNMLKQAIFVVDTDDGRVDSEHNYMTYGKYLLMKLNNLAIYGVNETEIRLCKPLKTRNVVGKYRVSVLRLSFQYDALLGRSGEKVGHGRM